MTDLAAYYRFDQGEASGNNSAGGHNITKLVDYAGCNTGTLSAGFALTAGGTSNWIHPGNPEAPIPATYDATSIDFQSAQLNGEVFAIGETDVTTRGFCYATTDCPTISNNLVNETGTYAAGTYNLNATGLAMGTTYYYRSYLTNTQGTSYGETQSFTTTQIPLGNALYFDGTDDYVDLGNDASLNFGTGDFTVEAWIKTTFSGIQVAVGGGGGPDYWLGLNSTNHATFSISGTSCVGTSVVNDGNWHHITGVRESGQIYIYVDGVLENNLANALSANPPDNIYIGSFTSSSFFFTGEIDEVRIWNDARNLAQIQANMYSYITNMTDLAAYYRCDQGDASADNTTATGNNITELVDYAGCNTGTLTNFTLNTGISNWVATGNNEAPIPSATTTDFISYTSAGLTGNIFSIGETDVTTRGFQCATDACFTTGIVTTEETGTFGTGAYTLTANGLIANTLYYYRAYTTNTQGTNYSETRQFTTTNDAPPGTCLDFDGTDDFVYATGYKGITGTSSRTVEAWIKTNTMPPGDHISIISWGVYSDGSMWDISIDLSGWIGVGIYNGRIEGSTNLVDDTWHHIAVVLNNDGTPNVNEILLYVDGSLETISSSIPKSVNTGNGFDVTIGHGYFNEFQGQIDEVRIWNNARTQEEIINYMCRTIENPAGEANLVTYYQMDDGAGVSITDIKGSNTGTLANSDADEWVDSEAFNVWTGATNTTWATATNWTDGLPGATDNIHLGTANTPSTAGDLTINNAVVESGGTFTVAATNLFTVNSNLFPMGTMNVAGSGGADPGKVTVEGDLFVGTNGNLNLMSPSNDNPSGSLITNGAVSGTGTINIARYFTIDGTWQNVGVPMANQSTALFTENTPTGNYNANLYTYNEISDLGTDPRPVITQIGLLIQICGTLHSL